jgi:hypothetical protein
MHRVHRGYEPHAGSLSIFLHGPSGYGKLRSLPEFGAGVLIIVAMTRGERGHWNELTVM